MPKFANEKTKYKVCLKTLTNQFESLHMKELQTIFLLFSKIMFLNLLKIYSEKIEGIRKLESQRFGHHDDLATSMINAALRG